MVVNSRVAAPYLTLIVWGALLSFVAFSLRPAAAFITLKVEASNGLPGFPRADLSRYLASQMTEVGLSDWRFEPAAETGSGPDRVEWSFKLNPNAGGEVRRFGRSSIDDRNVHGQRSITIETRLYLHGEYQTLVEVQAVIDERRSAPRRGSRERYQESSGTFGSLSRDRRQAAPASLGVIAT
jgi:hypothetical protein